MFMRSMIVFSLFFMVLTHIAPASAEKSVIKSTETPPAFLDVSQNELPLNLTAGPVRGELTATPLEGRYTAGASAFVQLKLSSDDTGRKGASAELVLEPEYGEIVQVSGSADVAEEGNGRRVARVEGIRKNRSRTILIEMKLRPAEQGNVNRLKFALRVPGSAVPLPVKKGSLRSERSEIGEADRQMVALAWPVASCADQYHAALHEIGASGGNDLRKIWQAALKRDKSMSSRWMFSPSIPKRYSRRKSEPKANSISSRDARRIYLETRNIMRSGYDRNLRRKGRYGWIISKTANDLRKYFSQDMNPAICTGALGFASYYEDQLAPLRKRGERLDGLVEKGRQLAHEKTEKVIEMTRNLPGGHPAWGGAMLIALKPKAAVSDNMKDLAVELLQAVNFPDQIVERARRAENGYKALQIVDEEGLNAAALSKSLRKNTSEALAAIEAAVRLEHFRARYEIFSRGFLGKLEAIRSAHAQHCICSS